jgi:hypothetical protein
LRAILAGAVLGSAVLAGCATGSSRSARPIMPVPTLPPPTTIPRRAAPTTAPPTTVPRAARATTVRPLAGYVDATPPPAIHATGTNYVAIVQSLEAYRYWLLAHHPDSALVSEFGQRGTVTYDRDVADLDHLRSHHLTLISIGQHVTFTVASVQADLVTFRAHEVISEDRFLDREQRVLQTDSYAHDNDFVIVIVNGAGGRWRLADVTLVSLDPTIVL